MRSRDLITTALLATVVTCGAPPPSMPVATGPSVLIITLDTTRADRLGPYGYALADTPTYNRIANEGTVFERAYSTCPLTIPSHSTIFTGKAPPTHGVRDNGDFILGDNEVTLAERFQEAGYGTAAFTAAFPTQARWGFDQGFDIYHDPLERLPSQLDWRDQRRADEVVDDALATLPTFDGPVFSWVHLFDAHWPYDPPEPFLSEHAGRAYDGEIAFADKQVERLLEWWEANHPNSVILITADHGEGLGDGGEQTHGFLLHDGTIRIPMILKGPGVPVGERIADPVGHTDIAPTLLTLAGLPLHEGLQGKDLREGGSEVMYSEALTGQFNLGLAPLHAWTDGTGRYTEGGYGAFYPVINGSSVSAIPDADPARDSAEMQGLADRLHAVEEELGDGLAPTATLDAESLEMLSALGYVGGDPTAEAGEVDPRDVIDVIPLTWQIRQLIGMGMYRRADAVLMRLESRMPDTFGVDLLEAQLARKRGRNDQAIEAFTDLFLRSQSSTTALQLGGLYATVSNWREAEDWYAEALSLQPASPEAMGGLVRSMYAQGKLGLAEEAADRFLLIYPDHAELQLSRAEMMLHDGQPWNAIEDARRALEAMPYSPWAHAVTGQVLWELGESEDAIERLQDALKLNPYNASVRVALSECLLEVGRSAEAVRILAPLARLMPDNEDIQSRYGAAREALSLERQDQSHPKTSDLSRGG